MWLFHDFGVVDSLTLDVVIGGDIMRFHNAQLKYSNFLKNSIELKPECFQCIINKHLLKGLADGQLSFIDWTVRSGRRRDPFRRTRACYIFADGSEKRASSDTSVAQSFRRGRALFR